LREILNKVLTNIKPDEKIKHILIKTYNKFHEIIQSCYSQIGLQSYEITLQGSVAKDTFLKNDVDIDIFILFDPSKYSIDWLNKDFIEITSNCLRNSGYNVIIEYASHPYVVTYDNSFEINIVPAFRVSEPSKIISAVDRTPFHTAYIKHKLCEECKDEVRLLKYFLKLWNLYGAEIKTQGFSGYLVELLIIAYKSFENTLKNSLMWRAYKTCIDIEGYYKNEKECRKKFENDVLVVIDPVDANRNAASALSLKNFSMFKLLARLFLENPSEKFFEENHSIPSENNVSILIQDRTLREGLCYITIIFDIVKKIPDVIWGQLRRIQNSIRNTLNEQGFQCTFIDSWIDTNLTKAISIVELYECRDYEYRIGPPAYDPEAINFLRKNKDSVIGPWVNENGRLVCIRKRKRKPEDIIKDVLNQISPSSLRLVEIKRISSIHDVLISDEKSFIVWLRKVFERKQLNKVI